MGFFKTKELPLSRKRRYTVANCSNRILGNIRYYMDKSPLIWDLEGRDSLHEIVYYKVFCLGKKTSDFFKWLSPDFFPLRIKSTMKEIEVWSFLFWLHYPASLSSLIPHSYLPGWLILIWFFIVSSSFFKPFTSCSSCLFAAHKSHWLPSTATFITGRQWHADRDGLLVLFAYPNKRKKARIRDKNLPPS